MVETEPTPQSCSSISYGKLVVRGLFAGAMMFSLLQQRLTKHTASILQSIPLDPPMMEPIVALTRTPRKVLVAYSGPVSLHRSVGKNELYLRNFDFFLQHGIDCQHADTVISVGKAVEQEYRDKLIKLKDQNKCKIYTIIRNEECHDLATVHTLFYNSTVPTQEYDYFVYINCGMTGPTPGIAWLDKFLNPLSDTVKMSGLTINCFRKRSPHVQSMAYALDRVGLDIVLASGSIFDCRSQLKANDVRTFNKIVQRYEQGMSKAVLMEGYGLASILWPTVVFWHNRTNCTVFDRWSEGHLRSSYDGRLPHLNETLFFKSSRLLPKEIAEIIKYPGEPTWHAV